MFPMLASGGLVFFLDQWSKRAMTVRTVEGCIYRGPYLQIRAVAAHELSYRRIFPRVGLALVWLTAFASAILLCRSGTHFQTNVALSGLGLALGGALGNLFDILRCGYVVDFIDLGWWPVFNLADVAIVSGLALAFW